jgi:hypothetical protein
LKTFLRGMRGPQLLFLLFFTFQIRGEWLCSTVCSHHNVLPHHGPKEMGSLDHRLKLPDSESV